MQEIQTRPLRITPHSQLAVPTARRIALLIGNNNYSGAKLSNCKNDARGMEQTLRKMGFSSIRVKLDVNKSQFKDAVRWLVDKSRDGCIGVFFFSGHGCEQDGENYLLPIGADVKRPEDVQDEYIRLNWVLESLHRSSKNSTFCLFLDCCRENHANTTWKKGVVSPGRGLSGNFTIKSPGPASGGAAEGQAHPSFFIGFAADPGQVALANSKSSMSPYTAALSRHLPTRREDIRLLYSAIRREVQETTQGQQRPWLNEALVHDEFIL